MNTFLNRELEYAVRKKTEPFPLIFLIQTVNLCNGSCIMCPNSTDLKMKPCYMTDQLFHKIIEEIAAESKMSLILFFLHNEPLLDRKIAEKIKLAKNIGGQVQTYFITNGSLCTSEIIQELEESDLDLLVFSIDGLTKETYERIRPRFNYDSVLENLERALQSKLNVGVKFTLQKGNIQELKAFKKYWNQRRVPLYINIVGNRAGNLKNYEQVFVSPQTFTLKRTIGKAYLKLLKCCPQVLSTFNILSNGDAIVCCNDFSRTMVLGNVHDTSIKEIWNGEQYQ